MSRLPRIIYNLLFPVVLVLLLPGFLHRMIRRGKYRHKFWQRFAIYSPRVRERIGSGRIWVHAVSVGETLIALKLIRAIRTCDPSAEFVLSTTTSTGFKLAARSKSPWLEPIYHPLDFLPVARRAARTIRPSKLILVEAEVWPNTVAEVRKAGARIFLVNTRLSPRSEARFRRIRPLAAWLFNQVDVLCLQEPADVARWTGLGVEKDRLVVTGSIKFDDGSSARPARDFRPVLAALGVREDAPVLLGGSTFEGEEIALARTLRSLRAKHPSLFLVIVPRHVERTAEIVKSLAAEDFRVALRRGDGTIAESPDLLVVDTTGELRDWYSLATVVFVGKSLTARGGQNPAEPVVAGAPVIFGPHMQNFATLARQFLGAKAAVEVHGENDLAPAVADLLGDPDRRAEMVRRARECLAIHSGATARTCTVLGFS